MTGAENPPVTVPETAQRLLRPPLKVMIALPPELTARLRLCAGPTLPSIDSVVAGPQLLLPAGRTASVVSPGFVDQPAMTLPAPSVPITSPPVDRSRLVLRVTATTMRRPELGALPPWPRSVACQVFPFGLVHTWTCVVPSEAVKVPPAA